MTCVKWDGQTTRLYRHEYFFYGFLFFYNNELTIFSEVKVIMKLKLIIAQKESDAFDDDRS